MVRPKEKPLINKIEENGMRIIEVATPAKRRVSMYRRILNYLSFTLMTLFAGIRVKKVDLIYVRTPPILVNLTGWLLAQFKGCRYVLEIADLHPDESIALGLIKSPFIIRLWERWENFFRNRADLIVAVVPGIKRLLMEKGFDGEKIVVVTNAYDAQDMASYPANIPELKETLEKLSGKFLVMYTGSMGKAMALEPTLEAAKLLQNKQFNVHFLYIGDGDKRKKLIEICHKQGIQNCTFLDPVPRTSISYLLSRANVVFLSFYSSPFHGYNLPNKIFEYLGSGKPIIYAGSGDVADIIDTAHCGIVVPPEDPKAFAKAVIYLYTHKEEAKKMGLHGREYVLTHFNRERILEKLNKRLSKLI